MSAARTAAAGAGKPPIAFYFEFASAYGYFASKSIEAVAARHGREVDWRPILMGPVRKVTGSRPKAETPLKGPYYQRDVARCAGFYRLPYRLPPVNPMNSLPATRAYYWLQESDPARAKALAAALLDAHWGEGRDLSAPEAVAAVAAAVDPGIDTRALLRAVEDPRIKDKVTAITMQSVADGVFGSPIMVVDGETFWGADRLPHLDRWLATGGW